MYNSVITNRDKVTQFFTTKAEYERAKELGIDMSDSFFIADKNTDTIMCRNQNDAISDEFYPVYTLPEILYKLPEWVAEPYNNPIQYLKDAPFYGFCLYTKTDEEGTRTQEDIDARIECISEYPIRGAMAMLFECAKNPKLWYSTNIADK